MNVFRVKGTIRSGLSLGEGNEGPRNYRKNNMCVEGERERETSARQPCSPSLPEPVTMTTGWLGDTVQAQLRPVSFFSSKIDLGRVSRPT